MECCSSVCLDFPSWCKRFATVPLQVSPSTHLICLTLYALTMLNFCRSSGRVCAWNLPEYKQQNSDKHKLMLLFTAHHSCFCTSCIVPAAFTTRTCTTYHLVTAFKTFSFFICFRAIIPLLIDIKMLKICPG